MKIRIQRSASTRIFLVAWRWMMLKVVYSLWRLRLLRMEARWCYLSARSPRNAVPSFTRPCSQHLAANTLQPTPPLTRPLYSPAFYWSPRRYGVLCVSTRWPTQIQLARRSYSRRGSVPTKPLFRSLQRKHRPTPPTHPITMRSKSFIPP